jgi:hypothetical protein
MTCEARPYAAGKSAGHRGIGTPRHRLNVSINRIAASPAKTTPVDRSTSLQRVKPPPYISSSDVRV